MNESMRQTAPEAGEGERLTHLFFLLCTALVGAFAAWSYIGQLDVVSSAVGEVIPSTQVKSVQHLEGGIVREILVREGDRVAKDQPLISLEPTASGADVDELRSRITALKADVARLQAEATGADAPVFPAELTANHADLVSETVAMFKTRKNRIENQLAGQRQQISQHRQEMAEISSRIKNSRERLKLLDEQIRISEELMKDQLTNRMQHLDLLKDAAGLKGRIAEDQSALRRARAAHDGATNKLEAIRHSFREKVREELEKKRRSVDEFSSRVRKFEDSLRRTVLRRRQDAARVHGRRCRRPRRHRRRHRPGRRQPDHRGQAAAAGHWLRVAGPDGAGDAGVSRRHPLRQSGGQSRSRQPRHHRDR